MVMRLSGLASGLDTDTVIKQLMTAQRAPVDKIFQKKKTVEWQRQSLLDMNTKLYDYRNNKLFNSKLEGNLSARKADLGGDTEAISVVPTGDAQPGEMTVKVKTVATAASNYSSSEITIDTTFDPNATLDSQKTKLFSPFTNNTVVINGKTVAFDPSKDSLNAVLSRISKETNVSAFYDAGIRKVSLVAKQTGKVNGASGTEDKITFDGSLLEDSLKLKTGPYDTDGNGTPDANPQEKSAVDAEVYVNDMLIKRTSNTFRINGLDITVKKASNRTDADNPATYTGTTISTSTNTDKILETVKGFIKDYNEMLKTLQDKVSEKRYRDFPPLTDEQKKDMKDKEIELWEEKAQSGTLKDDSILTKLISKMRSAIIARVDNGSSKYNTLSSIGIVTGNYQENGKLYLENEEKLKEAIEKDPQAFIGLISANGNGDPKGNDIGVAERIYTAIDDAMKEIKQKAGTSSLLSDSSILGLQMERLNKELDAGNQRLVEVEKNYYRKFTAMETAMQRYNAQSTQLSNAFSAR
ncbi:flagellar filament capping protein FliD [Paenibacillus sp.]|uniref:flagellar filament capping protein FliD n=1 Tax=Paenibacillus sp. TaxID=58172 RepID=UPI003567A1FA